MSHVDYRLPHKPRQVVIQGERGSNSHDALLEVFPNANPRCSLNLTESFSLMTRPDVDLALIPVKNTIADKVPYTMKLVRDTGMKIVGEIFKQINHCVLGLPGADLSKATAIYSHPHALGQCTEWLAKYPHISPIEYYDTAGAAKDVKLWQDPTQLAIAPMLAAKEYNLGVLAEKIQDNKESNITHFLVLSRELQKYPSDSRPYVTSMLLDMRNSGRKKAYLNEARIVQMFNGLGHSVVHKEDFTGLYFRIPTLFVEVEGHEDAPLIKKGLSMIKADGLITSFSPVGCYPTHPSRPY